jgi:hypothetical protein
MAGQVRNAKLDTKAARARLEPRPSPYWHRVGETGCYVGYRGVAGGFGFWLARWGSQGRLQEKLGTADDTLDANGDTILTWPQAQEPARGFFDRCERGAVGKAGKAALLTVAAAFDATGLTASFINPSAFRRIEPW